jgi:hypothetical protein
MMMMMMMITTGTVSIKIEVWVVTPHSLTNGTTISEASAASIFSVSWNHTTCHRFWKDCSFDAHHWILQIFVVNVSSCSHAEFPALCCKVKSVTFHEVEIKLYQRPQDKLTIMEYMDIKYEQLFIHSVLTKLN